MNIHLPCWAVGALLTAITLSGCTTTPESSHSFSTRTLNGTLEEFEYIVPDDNFTPVDPTNYYVRWVLKTNDGVRYEHVEYHIVDSQGEFTSGGVPKKSFGWHDIKVITRRINGLATAGSSDQCGSYTIIKPPNNAAGTDEFGSVTTITR